MSSCSFASRAKQLIRQKNSESSPRPLKRQYGTYCSPHPPYQSALQSVLGPVLSPKFLMPPADCFRMPTEVRSSSLIGLPEPSRSERLTERAVGCLTSAVSLRILGFANDPFCTYDHWLTEELKRLPWRASSTTAARSSN